ncbi:MAG TPA: hypothetical protein VKB10_03435 [Gaiellaceae bacterium]|nr:hypothetical protein [Gaiellaceae bacterium]
MEMNRSTPVPSVDDVRRIVGIENPVIRNLEITYCYSRLAAALAARCRAGANWSTFATWASRQAGRTIRGEDLLDDLGRRLGEGRWLLHPFATLGRRLVRRGLFQRGTRIGRLTAALHTPFDAFELASDAVARGNLKVFEEIGLEFARYLNGEQSLDALRPGDPPEGQRYLRRAFARYDRLQHEHDPKARTELAVLANLEIGFHEQTRLQPEICEALDAAHTTQEDLGRRALEALAPSAERWWSIVRRPAAAVAGAAAAGAQRSASRLAREVITESFLVLSLPGRVLALGTNLADPYPEALAEPANEELIELLARFEPVSSEPDDCGARDWSDLQQRMHYIVHMFRALHVHRDLSRTPFTPEQVTSLSHGIVPDGAI